MSNYFASNLEINATNTDHSDQLIIHSLTSAGNYLFAVGNGIARYIYTSSQLDNTATSTDAYVIKKNYTYNHVYALTDSNAIAVGNNILSYTVDGTSWTDFIPSNNSLTSLNINSVFIFDSSNAVAVSENGQFIYSTNWKNGSWAFIPDSTINSSGMKDRVIGGNNKLKSIHMSDIETFIISDSITTFPNSITYYVRLNTDPFTSPYYIFSSTPNGTALNTDSLSLNLQKGVSYIFKRTDSGHAFNIGTDWKQNTSGIVFTSTSNNDLVNGVGSIQNGEEISFIVPNDITVTLKYYCYLHSSMINSFNIIDPETNSSYDIRGISKIQYCFLPNLFNRVNNDVLDISGNMVISGDIDVLDGGNVYIEGDVSMNTKLMVASDVSFNSK